MNEQDARQRIQALKFLYGHALTYAVFMAALAAINFTTYSPAEPEIWFVKPLVAWGAFVLVHWLIVYLGSGGAKQWEESKLRELTGWSATRKELARLSERVETLLSILSDERDREADVNLEAARSKLLDAKRAIRRNESPLDESAETALSKREVVELIERLEAALTDQRLRRFEEILADTEADEGAPTKH